MAPRKRWQPAGRIGYHQGNDSADERVTMPQPIQVKIFMDTRPAALEEQINAWLAQLGKAVVIRSETVVTAIAEKPNIVVTVWYELQSN
jgi:hypothetical protein